MNIFDRKYKKWVLIVLLFLNIVVAMFSTEFSIRCLGIVVVCVLSLELGLNVGELKQKHEVKNG